MDRRQGPQTIKRAVKPKRSVGPRVAGRRGVILTGGPNENNGASCSQKNVGRICILAAKGTSDNAPIGREE